MAITQTPIQRTVTQPTSEVSAGTGIRQLDQATQAVGKVVNDRLTQVAIEQAATKGALDESEGRAPESLAPGLTSGTRAYNKAVIDTEARHMKTSAQDLINESVIVNKDPATFNAGTLNKHKAEMTGIKEGILKNVRPENRAEITESLDRMINQASLDMHAHAIKYDNAVTQNRFKDDMSRMLQDKTDASIAGNTQRVEAINKELKTAVADYSAMNEGIRQNAPARLREIEDSNLVDQVLADYSKAAVDGTTTQFKSELTENKQKLPSHVLEDAMKAVSVLDNRHKNLNLDLNAEVLAGATRSVKNGTINKESQILALPQLTNAQKLTLGSQLDTVQKKLLDDGNKAITFKQNISSGNPTFNSATERNKGFQKAKTELEAQKGNPASMTEMEEIILGTNAFPGSGMPGRDGMPGMSMGANVPDFDGTVTNALTSRNPLQIAQAGLVYNSMVNVKEAGGMLKIGGDALAVAELFNTFKDGMPIDEAAQLASDTVFKVDEPERKLRAERFKNTIGHVDRQTHTGPLDAMYLDFTGSNPQEFKSNNSFAFFKETMRAMYMSSGSLESASKATKYIMRDFQTSKYMDEGFVGNQTPETKVSVVDKGHSFGNQIFFNLQGYMDRNNKLSGQNPDLNMPKYEWADPNQKLPTDISDSDRVLKNYSLVSGAEINRTSAGLDRSRQNNSVYSKPRIKINGVETDVVLMQTPISRLGNAPNYTLGVYDRFNNLHALRDSSNSVNGTATFVPQSLELWAPKVALDQENIELRKRSIRDVEKTTRREVKHVLATGDSSQFKYVQHLRNDTREDEIVKNMELLRKNLKPNQPQTKAQVRDSLTTTEDIGIADQPVVLKNPKDKTNG